MSPKRRPYQHQVHRGGQQLPPPQNRDTAASVADVHDPGDELRDVFLHHVLLRSLQEAVRQLRAARAAPDTGSRRTRRVRGSGRARERPEQQAKTGVQRKRPRGTGCGEPGLEKAGSEGKVRRNGPHVEIALGLKTIARLSDGKRCSLRFLIIVDVFYSSM